ncbi:MAG TPA: putative Ig domain-containing protein [Candidatus Acidoferrum sp.]|nr:putative Ig domain-containing protein [Candidatus Acidoferrum sp.]
MYGKTKVLGVLLAVFALAIAGCTGGSTPISVGLSPSGAQNAIAGKVINLTATVSNDSKNAGVTWSLTGPGALSAQTTTSVTYTAPSPISANATATITATSVTNTAKSATLTINLQAVSIGLTPSAAQTLEQTQTVGVTAAISNDPSATPSVTWSLNAGAKGTLSGQTATGVTYHAPASVTAASTDTLTATSVFDSTKTATLTINLVPPPSITTASLPAGTVGTAYTTTNLAATGGVSPYTWSVTAGALPGGLTLSSAGAISGTPTAFGTFNFTVQVKDASNFTATANLSIKVNPAPVVITTTSLPNGVVNTPGYSATLTATGGAPPITWSITAGSLPTGLVLNAATGAITGTPTTAGTSNFTVQAADSSTPALTATKALSITIIPALTITTTSLPNGITSTAYSATLTSTGGSGAVAWSVTVGSLPAGLTLNANTGAITGTPTTAGTSNFTVQAADSGTPQQKVTKALSITIVQQLVVTTSALPSGAITSTYSATLSSSGGTPAVTWAITVGSLPAGLTLNAATGAITGTPTGPSGMSGFTVQATDSGTPQQTATKALSINVNPVLSITTTSLASGTVNTTYSQQLQTNGGGIAPITWSITLGSLPPGLTLNASTGVISGTPTTATGSPFNFTVQAADSGTPQQTATQALSISIATAPLSVATTGLPNGIQGQAYSATLQSAGGNPPVTWSISAGSLPSWASLNTSTGAITGTPNATGTTTFTAKATDSTTPTAQTATKSLSITVVNALSITTSSLPAGTVGSPYNTTVAATGGTTPYTWSWAAQGGSSLPPGLSISSSTGVISGTPSTNTGSPFNVTVTVTDATNPQQTASANFSITITVATLTVTTTSSQLPAGTVNTAYPNNVNLAASGGIPPYTWSQTGGTLPPGLTLSSSGAISGTPTITTGSPFSFTVQVADSATPTPNTAPATLSITVNAAPTCTTGGSEALLSGGYAFLLKGFDNGTGAGETGPEPALVGGVLTFNGSGAITAGAIDMNLNSGVQSLTVTSGTYGVGSDHRGCMVVTTSGGTQNYRFSVANISGGVASTAHLINFDTAGPFTAGTMLKQSGGPFSNASVSGSYAFGGSSIQNSAAGGGKFGLAGIITFNGSGGITSGSEDINQNGTLDGSAANTTWPATSPINFTSLGSSYSISSNGRGTMTIAITGVANPAHSFLYGVSSSHAFFMTSDAQTTTGISGGEALKQSGSFSANPLSGSYVGYDSGLGSGGAGTDRTDIILLGPLTSGNSTLTGTQQRNDGGVFSSGAISGTYSVSSAGRMMISGGGTHQPILYLVSTSQAFFLSGNGGVDSGFFQSQTGTSPSNGTYAFGTIDPEESSGSDSSGVAVFTTSTTSISVTEDDNSSGSQTLGGTQSFVYSVDSTGLIHIPTGCTVSSTSTTCQTLVYVISPTKAVVMDTTSTNPRIQIADQ